MQNTKNTPYKELKNVMYGTPFCVIIYSSYKLLNTVQLLVHPVYPCSAAYGDAYAAEQSSDSWNYNFQRYYQSKLLMY